MIDYNIYIAKVKGVNIDMGVEVIQILECRIIQNNEDC